MCGKIWMKHQKDLGKKHMEIIKFFHICLTKCLSCVPGDGNSGTSYNKSIKSASHSVNIEPLIAQFRQKLTVIVCTYSLEQEMSIQLWLRHKAYDTHRIFNHPSIIHSSFIFKQHVLSWNDWAVLSAVLLYIFSDNLYKESQWKEGIFETIEKKLNAQLTKCWKFYAP